MKFQYIILFLFFLPLIARTQQVFDFSDTAVERRIKKDIMILASDSLMGREAGTEGEIKAIDYIVNSYEEIGIKPAFKDGSYLQSFTFMATPTYGDSNFLKIGKKIFKLEKDFFPLPYSANGSISGELVRVGYGIIIPEMNYDDYKNNPDINKGKIFVIETSIPREHASDSLFLKYVNLQKKVDTAVAKGAAGIIFINSSRYSADPSKYLGMRAFSVSIPVIFADRAVCKQILKGKKYNADVKVNIIRKTNTAYNIAGYIDNNALSTIVIGGHYDHLGYGKENSMYTGNIPMIHNGADDNASGTAAVIEMARYFINSPKKKNNYLFVNFSAEEKGLIGSSYFVKSDELDLTKINYMVNIDMIGRYDTSKLGLNIIGSGTSPVWDTLISLAPHQGLKVKKTKSGFDGSDQISFYLKDIPVLFFFTGIHADYHKPSDDADKLNYSGEAEIIRYAEKIIEKTDTMGKIPFSKTVDPSSKRSFFSVTLGVIPNHSHDGKGMRIEGVLDDKPAIKAGLKTGDIVIKIGDYDVLEIMSYMKALSKFKKGDKTTVVVKRGEETLTKEIEF